MFHSYNSCGCDTGCIYLSAFAAFPFFLPLPGTALITLRGRALPPLVEKSTDTICKMTNPQIDNFQQHTAITNMITIKKSMYKIKIGIWSGIKNISFILKFLQCTKITTEPITCFSVCCQIITAFHLNIQVKITLNQYNSLLY